ncbi:hypothetical protein QTO34_016749, partial [Cnephaeus nilssonii]
MPGQIPDPSMTVGSLPGLRPLTRLPSSALTAEELIYADIHNIGATITPLHFLEVKLGKRPQPVKSELEEEEERRKGRREKNKVVAAPCQEKKKERKECLQRESEWLELMSAELKTQMEELKQERQQFILMLNRHRPTCIVRTDSVKTPDSEGNPLLEPLEKKREEEGVPEGSSLLHEKLFSEAQHSQHQRGFFEKLRSATPGEETQADETQDRALRPKLAGGRTEALGWRDAQPGSCGHFSCRSARAPTQRTSEQPGKAMIRLEKGTVPGLLYPPTMVQLSPAWSSSLGASSPALRELLGRGLTWSRDPASSGPRGMCPHLDPGAPWPHRTRGRPPWTRDPASPDRDPGSRPGGAASALGPRTSLTRIQGRTASPGLISDFIW